MSKKVAYLYIHLFISYPFDVLADQLDMVLSPLTSISVHLHQLRDDLLILCSHIPCAPSCCYGQVIQPRVLKRTKQASRLSSLTPDNVSAHLFVADEHEDRLFSDTRLSTHMFIFTEDSFTLPSSAQVLYNRFESGQFAGQRAWTAHQDNQSMPN